MRSAGCIFNDIIDKDFDRNVPRTKNRPLASREVSTARATLLMVLLCLGGFAVLTQLNKIAVLVGLSSLPLIIAYPFMKRITWWPQLWLGLTFNWGALISCAAVEGRISAWSISLYVGGIFWTLGYDTIYAHQDKLSDALIGVKSSALKLGSNSKLGIAVAYVISLSALYVSATLANLSWPSFLGLCLGSLHLLWQVYVVNLDEPESCLRIFKSNHIFAAILFAGFIAG